MKILVDTSVLVEIDRQNKDAVVFLQHLLLQNHELFISTITVAEIFTGCYLQKNSAPSVQAAREILNNFLWVDFDCEAAEIAAQLYAKLFLEKKQDSIEYADVLIAACFFHARCDVLLTLNKKDFVLIELLKEKVFTLEELKKSTFVQYIFFLFLKRKVYRLVHFVLVMEKKQKELALKKLSEEEDIVAWTKTLVRKGREERVQELKKNGFIF